MKAVHFGAGNIGRGFIGEMLYKNGFSISFVDVNDQIIDALKERGSYTIELADEAKGKVQVENVTGLHNIYEVEAIIEAIKEADLVTTAIGPDVLPIISTRIAQGIDARQAAGITKPLDVIACENMIGGSSFLYSQVQKHLQDLDYAKEYIGFPDAAVDRIVPMQKHEDVLFVQVEPFCEWVVEAGARKNQELELTGVHYVEELEPYIERKLFTVNTGHATVAYTGGQMGYETIDEAMQDYLVVAQLKAVLNETGNLIVNKWGFDKEEHEQYIQKIISRFQNKHISDAISRVARTPLRKLGSEERFIRPLRELQERQLETNHLMATIGMVFNYHHPEDEQSVQMNQMLKVQDFSQTITQVTGIKDEKIVSSISENIERYAVKA